MNSSLATAFQQAQDALATLADLAERCKKPATYLEASLARSSLAEAFAFDSDDE